MLFFIGYEAYVILARKHPAISVKISHHDLSEEPGGVFPFKYGFDIAVGMTTKNKGLLPMASSNLINEELDRNEEIEEHVHLNYLDPSFGSFSASYDVIKWDKISNEKTMNSTPIQLGACPKFAPKFKPYQGFSIVDTTILENN